MAFIAWKSFGWGEPELASFPGAQNIGESAWYTLFAHAHEKLLWTMTDTH